MMARELMSAGGWYRFGCTGAICIARIDFRRLFYDLFLLMMAAGGGKPPGGSSSEGAGVRVVLLGVPTVRLAAAAAHG